MAAHFPAPSLFPVFHALSLRKKTNRNLFSISLNYMNKEGKIVRGAHSFSNHFCSDFFRLPEDLVL